MRARTTIRRRTAVETCGGQHGRGELVRFVALTKLTRRVARNFQLKLHMRQSDRPRVVFEGFKRDVGG